MLLEMEGTEWNSPGRSSLFPSRLLAPPSTRSLKPEESSLQIYYARVLSILSSWTGMFSKVSARAPVSVCSFSWTACYSPLMGLSASSATPPIGTMPRLSWLPFAAYLISKLLTVALETARLGYFANVISTLLVPVGVPAPKSVPLHAVPFLQDHCKPQHHLSGEAFH